MGAGPAQVHRAQQEAWALVSTLVFLGRKGRGRVSGWAGLDEVAGLISASSGLQGGPLFVHYLVSSIAS